MLAIKPVVGDFPKLPSKKFPRVQEKDTPEAKYWRTFTTAAEYKVQGSPNSINFNPTYNYIEAVTCSYLVTASIRVGLYDIHDKLQRAYSRFHDDAYCARFRGDAKLICAGDKTGVVTVFDTPTKAVLRQMKQHTAAVKAIAWSCDGTNIVSGSDDKRVLRFDLPTEEVLWSSSKGGHTDYVRAMDSSPQCSQVFASGSYDHMVKLWDSRQPNPALNMGLSSLSGSGNGSGVDDGENDPIECVLFAKSAALLLAAQGPRVRVWDLLGGGRLLHTFHCHQKNVSGLCLDGSNRFLSCGLDGLLKICNLTELKLEHGMRYPDPLTAVAVSPEEYGGKGTRSAHRKLALASMDGTVRIRTRGKGRPRAGETDDDDMRGSSDTEDYEEEAVAHSARLGVQSGIAAVEAEIASIRSPSRQRLQPHEKLLKSFSYAKALDAALGSRQPNVVVSLMQELIRRGALDIALRGRTPGDERDESDDKDASEKEKEKGKGPEGQVQTDGADRLEPLLSFAARHISDPKYARVIVQVVHCVLDLYAGSLGHSEAVDDLFCKLQRQIKGEVSFQRQAMRIVGSLDGIINVATMPPQRRHEHRDVLTVDSSFF